MMIKSIITHTKKENKYPKLMTTAGGRVAIFTAHRVGFLIVEDREGQPIGFHSTTWSESSWVPLEGTVTLSNDTVK